MQCSTFLSLLLPHNSFSQRLLHGCIMSHPLDQWETEFRLSHAYFIINAGNILLCICMLTFDSYVRSGCSQWGPGGSPGARGYAHYYSLPLGHIVDQSDREWGVKAWWSLSYKWEALSISPQMFMPVCFHGDSSSCICCWLVQASPREHPATQILVLSSAHLPDYVDNSWTATIQAISTHAWEYSPNVNSCILGWFIVRLAIRKISHSRLPNLLLKPRNLLINLGWILSFFAMNEDSLLLLK